jgi:hypothetical protein
VAPGILIPAVTESDNLPAWTGQPGWYEVWFLTCTDPAAGHGYWLRSTITAPTEGPPYGAVWFARFDRSNPAGTFGIHRRVPIEEAKISSDQFDVRIAESVFHSKHLEGSIEGDGHSARWELEFPTGDPTYRVLPQWMYRGSLAPTKPLSPNLSTAVTGRIEVDGQALEMGGAPAQQGHLTGRRHAERWAWAHCADFDEEDAVVQALTAQGRRGPFDTPFVTSIGIRWRGRWIRLSEISRHREFDLGIWRLNLGDRRYRLTGRFEAPTEAMVRTMYEDPDGTPRFCHNSEVSSCRLVLFERRPGGFEELALLESRGTTHAEWAGRTPARSVAREHVEVP